MSMHNDWEQHTACGTFSFGIYRSQHQRKRYGTSRSGVEYLIGPGAAWDLLDVGYEKRQWRCIAVRSNVPEGQLHIPLGVAVSLEKTHGPGRCERR